MYEVKVFGNVGSHDELLWQEGFEQNDKYWYIWKENQEVAKITNLLDIAGLCYNVEKYEDFGEIIWDNLDFYYSE